MKRITLTLIALTLLTILSAQEPARAISRIDSLLAAIDTLEGEEKLNAYHETHILMYDTDNYDRHERLLSDFLHDAQASGSPRHEAFARSDYLSLNIYYNRNDEYERRLPDDLAFFRHQKLWDFYFFEQSRYTHYLANGNRNEEALAVTEEMRRVAIEDNYPNGLGVAAAMTGEIYMNMGNDSTAHAVLREAIALLTGTEEREMLHDAYDSLVQSLTHTGNYDEARETLDRWADEIANLQSWAEEIDAVTSIRYVWRDYYNTGTRLYLELEDAANAEAFLNRAEALSPNVDRTQYHLRLNRARLLALQGRLEEAYAQAEEARRLGLSLGDVNTIIHALQTKAEISAQISGDARTAALYRELIACNDSIQHVEMNARLDEIRTRYEVDRHILEKQRNRTYALLAAGSFLLALIALAIWAAYSRRLHRKNLSLVQQIKEHDQLLANRDRQEEELRRYHTQQPHNASDEAPAEENTLFCKLTRLMKDSEVYTNPDITRKSLADALRTNESYLHNAIREATGLSYATYISELRLAHAKKLLDQPAQQHTIEAIAIDSGFGSRSTLLRQFRQKYGLSPDEYRRLSNG